MLREGATITGRAGRRRPWSPPAVLDADSRRALVVLAVLMGSTTFAASLLSQHVDYVADAFGASNRTLGGALALTRAGVVLALLLIALADRRGRRVILLGSFVGVCVFSAGAALSPSLGIFVTSQIFLRAFASTAGTVALIAAIEEAPEGARAWAVAGISVAGACGYGLGVVLLPLADLHPQAWRVSFLLAAGAQVLLLGFRRHLRETSAYAVLADRTGDRGGAAGYIGGEYGRRFVLLLVTSFIFAAFTSPIAQFTNRYLADERGFSGFDISAFRILTQALPGIAGLIIGGWLAETLGRRPVATVAFAGATVAEIGFLLVTGPALWVCSAAGILLAGIAGPALGAYNGELFPTEARGTANALQLLAGVVGAAVGLLIAGHLADSLSLGRAIAVLGLPSLVAAIVLLPRLPEPAHRTLEELSPSCV